MLISINDYKRNFEGFRLLDCAVRNKDILCLTLMQDYENKPPPKVECRVITCFLRKPDDKRWARAIINNFDRLKAGATIVPKEQFVGVDRDGSVYVLGGGDSEMEADIPKWRVGGPNRGGIRKTRMIDGHLYICGGGRSVGKRLGKNQWHSFTQSIADSDALDIGFDDIDGFNANDIYCIGGAGDVWHYDGSRWQQCAFPSNRYLESVCCAGDGYVYIGGQSGYVFKGRGEQWKKIHQDNMTLGFNDMVWHQGKVWCTSDYGLWVIENDKLVAADVPPEIRACSGNLSVGDGVMLLAGMFGAAYHDGQQWHMLVDTQKMGQHV